MIDPAIRLSLSNFLQILLVGVAGIQIAIFWKAPALQSVVFGRLVDATVPFSKVVVVVARLREVFGEQFLVCAKFFSIVRDRIFRVPAQPVLVWSFACQKTGTRWRADRRNRISLFEPGTTLCNAFKGWPPIIISVLPIVPGKGNMISDNDNDVRAIMHMTSILNPMI